MQRPVQQLPRVAWVVMPLPGPQSHRQAPDNIPRRAVNVMAPWMPKAER